MHVRIALLACVASGLVFGCAEGQAELIGGDGGAGGTGGADASTATATSTSSGAPCTPGALQTCYSGPEGTVDVGTCKAGVMTCNADGSGFGPCTGEVLPAAEDCTTAFDENCDGQVNEVTTCICTPGEQQPCYSGPAGSDGVGVCVAGTATCGPDGEGFGGCAGEIIPGVEDCNNLTDDDCDGFVNEPDAGCADPCPGCTQATVGACASGVVTVGHYEGGSRTICIAQGNGTGFDLARMSYDASNWTLTGAVGRIKNLQVYSYDPATTVAGNAGVPTGIQIRGGSPADPYAYAQSMGDCPAHTGYAGAVFGVPQANVCHEETGLPGACSYPSYTCLAISP